MTRDRVLIVGGGKVGRSLHRAAVRAGVDAHLARGRSAEARARALKRLAPTLVVLAVPDAAVPSVGAAIAEALAEARRAAIVHTSGRLGPEALDEARALGVAAGQMHPLASFVTGAFARLEGVTLLVAGDPRARAAAARFGRALGMAPRRFDRLPRPLYHAAAALAANGAAALAAAAVSLLERGGVPRRDATAMIGPLLESVARNVSSVGLPDALSGPVRRGDSRAVEEHLAAVARATRGGEALAWVGALYRASATAQLHLAAALGEAPRAGLAEIQGLVAHHGAGGSLSALRPRKR